MLELISADLSIDGLRLPPHRRAIKSRSQIRASLSVSLLLMSFGLIGPILAGTPGAKSPEDCDWCREIAVAAIAKVSNLQLSKPGSPVRAFVPPAALGSFEARLPSGAIKRFEVAHRLDRGVSLVTGRDTQGRRLLMLIGQGYASGSVDSPNDRYSIKGNGALWQIEERQAHVEYGQSDFVVPPNVKGGTVNREAPGLQVPPAPAALSDAVDILFLYTAELKTALGEATMIASFVYYVQALNDSLSASDVPWTYNLQGIEESGVSNGIDTLQALDAVRQDPDARAKRDAYGADLVMLFRSKTRTNGFAGQAFLFNNQSNSADFGYGVSNVGCVVVDTNGNEVPCTVPPDNYADLFLHEVGHMMGGGHEIGSASGDVGWKAYSHAFSGCGPPLPNAPRISLVGSAGSPVRLYSNPAKSNGGIVCGDTATADNARTFRESLPTIAQFRSRPSGATPRVRLIPSVSSLIAGSSATLTWFAVNSDTCTAAGLWTGGRGLSGRQSISPTTAGSNTYSITCTGPGGTSTDTASIAVLAQPAVTLQASPATAAAGSNVTLTWSSTNAIGCAATGAWTGSKPTSGAESVVPSATGTSVFTLTCTGAAGTPNATATATVTVTPRPATVSVSASPVALTLGAATTLTWSTTNASACTASGAWSGSKGTSGTESVTPAVVGSSVFSLSCTSTSGGPIGTGSVAVTVNPRPPTVSLTLSPASVTSGSPFTASWSSTDAAVCSASGDWSGTKATSGSESIPTSGVRDLTLTLACSGPGGSATASRTLTVSAPPAQSSSGGGGATSIGQLGGLGIWLALVPMMRRRMHSQRAHASGRSFGSKSAA